MNKSSEQILFQERVLPGISFYAACSSIPLGLLLVLLPFGEELAYLVVLSISLSMFLLSYFLAPKIVITESTLQVGKAEVERTFLGDVTHIPEAEAFVERGQRLSAKAFIRFQFGIKSLVKVILTDSNDPTPYWLFSSRQADLIAKILAN